MSGNRPPPPRRGLAIRLYDRLSVRLLRAGLPFPPYSRKNALVMETIGRRTAKRRLVPMGYVRASPDRLYVVAERGRRADWVRNAMAAGSVRLWIGRREHLATVEFAEGADPEHVLRAIGSRFHSAAIHRLGEDSRVMEIRLSAR